MLAARDTAAAPPVSPEVRGPTITRAPSETAARAASAAPAALPRVSCGTKSTPGLACSNRARVAAFSMAWPSGAWLPDRGSSSATLARGGSGALGAVAPAA